MILLLSIFWYHFPLIILFLKLLCLTFLLIGLYCYFKFNFKIRLKLKDIFCIENLGFHLKISSKTNKEQDNHHSHNRNKINIGKCLSNNEISVLIESLKIEFFTNKRFITIKINKPLIRFFLNDISESNVKKNCNNDISICLLNNNYSFLIHLFNLFLYIFLYFINLEISNSKIEIEFNNTTIAISLNNVFLQTDSLFSNSICLRIKNFIISEEEYQQNNLSMDYLLVKLNNILELNYYNLGNHEVRVNKISSVIDNNLINRIIDIINFLNSNSNESNIEIKDISSNNRSINKDNNNTDKSNFCFSFSVKKIISYIDLNKDGNAFLIESRNSSFCLKNIDKQTNSDYKFTEPQLKIKSRNFNIYLLNQQLNKHKNILVLKDISIYNNKLNNIYNFSNTRDYKNMKITIKQAKVNYYIKELNETIYNIVKIVTSIRSNKDNYRGIEDCKDSYTFIKIINAELFIKDNTSNFDDNYFYLSRSKINITLKDKELSPNNSIYNHISKSIQEDIDIDIELKDAVYFSSNHKYKPDKAILDNDYAENINTITDSYIIVRDIIKISLSEIIKKYISLTNPLNISQNSNNSKSINDSNCIISKTLKETIQVSILEVNSTLKDTDIYKLLPLISYLLKPKLELKQSLFIEKKLTLKNPIDEFLYIKIKKVNLNIIKDFNKNILLYIENFNYLDEKYLMLSDISVSYYDIALVSTKKYNRTKNIKKFIIIPSLELLFSNIGDKKETLNTSILISEVNLFLVKKLFEELLFVFNLVYYVKYIYKVFSLSFENSYYKNEIKNSLKINEEYENVSNLCVINCNGLKIFYDLSENYPNNYNSVGVYCSCSKHFNCKNMEFEKIETEYNKCSSCSSLFNYRFYITNLSVVIKTISYFDLLSNRNKLLEIYYDGYTKRNKLEFFRDVAKFYNSIDYSNNSVLEIGLNTDLKILNEVRENKTKSDFNRYIRYKSYIIIKNISFLYKEIEKTQIISNYNKDYDFTTIYYYYSDSSSPRIYCNNNNKKTIIDICMVNKLTFSDVMIDINNKTRNEGDENADNYENNKWLYSLNILVEIISLIIKELLVEKSAIVSSIDKIKDSTELIFTINNLSACFTESNQAQDNIIDIINRHRNANCNDKEKPYGKEDADNDNNKYNINVKDKDETVEFYNYILLTTPSVIIESNKLLEITNLNHLKKFLDKNNTIIADYKSKDINTLQNKFAVKTKEVKIKSTNNINNNSSYNNIAEIKNSTTTTLELPELEYLSNKLKSSINQINISNKTENQDSNDNISLKINPLSFSNLIKKITTIYNYCDSYSDILTKNIENFSILVSQDKYKELFKLKLKQSDYSLNLTKTNLLISNNSYGYMSFVMNDNNLIKDKENDNVGKTDNKEKDNSNYGYVSHVDFNNTDKDINIKSNSSEEYINHTHLIVINSVELLYHSECLVKEIKSKFNKVEFKNDTYANIFNNTNQISNNKINNINISNCSSNNGNNNDIVLFNLQADFTDVISGSSGDKSNCNQLFENLDILNKQPIVTNNTNDSRNYYINKSLQYYNVEISELKGIINYRNKSKIMNFVSQINTISENINKISKSDVDYIINLYDSIIKDNNSNLISNNTLDIVNSINSRTLIRNQEHNNTFPKSSKKNFNTSNLSITNKNNDNVLNHTNTMTYSSIKNNNNDISKDISTNKLKTNTKQKFKFTLKKPQVILQQENKNSNLILLVKGNSETSLSKTNINTLNKELKFNTVMYDVSFYFNPYFSLLNKLYFIETKNNNEVVIKDKSEFQEIFFSPEIKCHFIQVNKKNSSIITNKKNNFSNYRESISIFSKNSKIADIDNEKDFNENELENNAENQIFKIGLDISKITIACNNLHYITLINILDMILFDKGINTTNDKTNIDGKTTSTNKHSLITKNEKEIKAKIHNYYKLPKSVSIIKEILLNIENIEIYFLEKKNNSTYLEMKLIGLEGGEVLYTNKSSDTKFYLKDVLINRYNSNKLILKRDLNIISGDIEDKLPIFTIRKKDSCISIYEELWNVVDSIEVNFLPIKIMIAKEEVDFIWSFFDLDDGKESNNFSNNNNNNNNKSSTNSDINGEILPIYFRKIKINNFELLLTFFYAADSNLNIKEAKLYFNSYEKQDKFFAFNELIRNYFYFTSNQLLNNIPKLLGKYLFGGGNEINKEELEDKTENDEANIESHIVNKNKEIHDKEISLSSEKNKNIDSKTNSNSNYGNNLNLEFEKSQMLKKILFKKKK